MLPNSDQGLGILLGTLGLGVLLLLASKAGFIHLSFFGFNFQRPQPKTQQELEWEREDRRSQIAVERRQIETAFIRYAEVAVGMEPMVSTGGPANEALIRWFDLVAGAIDAALTKQATDHFRVGIWADLGDPDAFTLLGCANLNRNDSRLQKLSKKGTVGGIAWAAKGGEYLCADISHDRKYKNRSGNPKPYQAIFAVRLGEAKTPWGVMTVDAPRINGFTLTDLAIIRRFAKLVSAGASVVVAKYAPRAVTGTSIEARGPARIVSTGGESAPVRLTTEEGTDDQP